MLLRLAAPAVALVAVLLPQELSFAPRFVAGDEFSLQVKHTREDSRQPAGNFTATTPVAVRVVTTGAAGTVLDWRPGDVTVAGGPAAMADPTAGLAGELFDDVSIRVALDPDGSFGKVENAKELLDKLNAALEVAIATMEKGRPAAEAGKVREVLAQILTPENLLNMATRDVQTWVAMNGVELPVNRALDVPVRQPNPFGGEPLTATLRLRAASDSARAATLLSETVYDTGELKKSTLALVERAAPQGRKPSAEEIASFSLELSDEGRYVFDRGIGLFREVVVTRRTGSSAGSVKATRSDRYEITLVTPPKR